MTSARARIGGETFFKFRHFGTHDVFAVVQNRSQAGLDPLADGGLLGFQIDKRRWAWRSWAWDPDWIEKDGAVSAARGAQV